ncbi:hypothetical protein QBC34DRAFT_425629 [Podospora aff. communis PSN243]|uniref:Uncharacterized protein n=1 Tax=Podospora aff. communis PSN243 TaxID=3040156 RepID=A0AAV9GMF9_9PEZI|nr:hypothetical protein QBC34DRAFT_425629 [Podospora aff. communis PSN243]
MGVSMSTLGGWAVISAVIGYYIFRSSQERRSLNAGRAGAHRQKLEERQNIQSRKEPKEKAKRQRGEAYSKDAEDSNKSAQPKQRASKPASAPTYTPDYSTDDGVDNREFAKQLASVKAGTNLNAPKKTDEKRTRSVKQSRAREIDEVVSDSKPSAPSSTAGADADDDQSSVASPEVKAADAGDVSDMLEPKSAGPAVLRLTDTEKVKQKPKKAKEPEKVETKKQRQNRQKAEAAKAEREEAEKARKAAEEAQRRLARISEGRAAKDGSAFMAAQAASKSAWNGNSTNGNTSTADGSHAAVQPLDTFDTSRTEAPAAKAAPPKVTQADNWMASLPSEEEQLEILRGEEEWSTVAPKKATKSKKKEPVAETLVEQEPVQAAPAASQPTTKPQKQAIVNGNTKPKVAFSQQSSFAALSTNDDDQGNGESEWDV